ncbi:MAG TPA: hypothetical protein VFH72_09280 [Candidatus Baltobacteraceae bacterium]|nr:hypothetical protein [Candidatus Baltobacteraceae bacterium]
MSNAESLERDVVDCGVPLGDARALRKRYERALQSGACADWIELYVGTFVTLLRTAHRTRRAQPDAARRLLCLLADDLGAQLFDEEALARIRHVVQTGSYAATRTGSILRASNS